MSRSETELRFFTQLLPLFGTFFGFLLTLIGLKYQSSGATLFHEHGTILLLIIIDVFTCIVALAVTILSATNTSYHLFFKSVCLISGAFACDLLLLVLYPPFGWFIFTICVLVLIYLLHSSYQQILKCCKEILQSISHYTFNAFHILCNWFKQNFPSQSIRRAPSQAFDGSPMLTPNITEKQVTKLEECITETLP